MVLELTPLHYLVNMDNKIGEYVVSKKPPEKDKRSINQKDVDDRLNSAVVRGNNKEIKKLRWIAETQMFQRIAKIQESSYEELSDEYQRK